MALAMKANCERCREKLPADSPLALICSFECTFCAACADDVLQDVCPNCGGNLEPRPIRPRRAWREGAGLANDPAGTARRHSPYTRDEIVGFVETLRATPPAER